MTENEFDKFLAENGFGKSEKRDWQTDIDSELHVHDPTVALLVTRGEFILVLENETTAYTSGGFCELPSKTIHTERTGAHGASTLIAYK